MFFIRVLMLLGNNKEHGQKTPTAICQVQLLWSFNEKQTKQETESCCFEKMPALERRIFCLEMSSL